MKRKKIKQVTSCNWYNINEKTKSGMEGLYLAKYMRYGIQYIKVVLGTHLGMRLSSNRARKQEFFMRRLLALILTCEIVPFQAEL